MHSTEFGNRRLAICEGCVSVLPIAVVFEPFARKNESKHTQ
ncbi:hypothetical protein [Brevundimonas sp.]